MDSHWELQHINWGHGVQTRGKLYTVVSGSIGLIFYLCWLLLKLQGTSEPEVISHNDQSKDTVESASFPAPKNNTLSGEQPPSSNPILYYTVSEETLKNELDNLISRREYAEALTRVDELLAAIDDPILIERLQQYKGNLLLSTGRYEEAYNIYWEIILSGAREDMRGFAVCKLYVTAKLLDRVEQLFLNAEEMVENHPRNLRWYNTLAELCAYHHLGEQEIAYRNTILTIDPNNIANTRALLDAYRKSGDFASAAKVAETLANGDPSRASAYRILQAQYLYNAGDSMEATALCERIIDSPQSGSKDLLYCGRLLEEMGQETLALIAYEKGVESKELPPYRKDLFLIEAYELKKMQGHLSAEEEGKLQWLAKYSSIEVIRRRAKTALLSDKE